MEYIDSLDQFCIVLFFAFSSTGSPTHQQLHLNASHLSPAEYTWLHKCVDG